MPAGPWDLIEGCNSLRIVLEAEKTLGRDVMHFRLNPGWKSLANAGIGRDDRLGLSLVILSLLHVVPCLREDPIHGGRLLDQSLKGQNGLELETPVKISSPQPYPTFAQRSL